MKIRRLKTDEPLPWKLLLDADPSRKEVLRYLECGELWIAEVDNKIIGAMVLLQTRKGVVEIMNIATDVKRRSKGIGTKLLKKARQRAKALGAKHLEVGTGNTSYLQLQFYQRFGFRIFGVRPNYFVGRYRSTLKDKGVVLRDMICMRLPI